jgi:hypothetical protein
MSYNQDLERSLSNIVFSSFGDRPTGPGLAAYSHQGHEKILEVSYMSCHDIQG